MGEQQYIPLREFVDKLDERYGHCGQHGQLFTRKTNHFVVTESLRPQIKGQRNSVPAPSFVWWLKTGEKPERVVKAKDGNRRNLRFDNLELYRTAEERFKERQAVWLAWCHSSKEERKEWLKTKPQPSAPRWVE